MTTKGVTQPLQEYLSKFENSLSFWLNGREIKIDNPDPSVLLVNFLHERGLTGTKVGCEEGGCGACTVMVSKRSAEGIDHRSINACLKPVVSLSGSEVTTVEGIGNIQDGLDEVQYRIASHNGSQCGFCTPGFVMNMHAFLRQNESPTEQQIEDIFGGNLCRCTGYRPILQGMRTFACDYEADKDCTQPCALDPFFELKLRKNPVKIEEAHLQPYGETNPLHFFKDGVHWIRPTSLSELKTLLSLLCEETTKDQIKLVVGNTAKGIYKNENASYNLDLSQVAELHERSVTDLGLHIGAAVSIQDLVHFAQQIIDKRTADQTKGLRQLVDHAQFVAGLQVRNAGSIAGNIFITKSHSKTGTPFPSDMFTVLASLGSEVTIASKSYADEARTFALTDMPIAEELPPDAIILYFTIPFCEKNQYIQTYRIARRPQMAHPIVNAGFSVTLNEQKTVAKVAVIYGGITSCNCRFPKTESALMHQKWNENTLQAILPILREEIKEMIIPMEEEGFTTDYRSQVAENFFYKFFLHVAEHATSEPIDSLNNGAANKLQRPLSTGLQSYDDEASDMQPLTSPVAKRTAITQATGEVVYVHDMALPPGGYHATLVISSRPHARFKYDGGLDATEQKLKAEFPGFAGLITCADIPKHGTNVIGLGGDEEIFSDGVVISVGAPICLVLADTQALSRRIAKHVETHCLIYEDLPAIVSFDEAIEKKNVMPMPGKKPDPDHRVIEVTREGSTQSWFADTSRPMNGGTVISGTVRTPAQAHFYMETGVAMAVPGSYDEMTVFSSTQNPNGDQAQIARALGIKSNQVTVRLEQLGGGFGGKQNRAVFAGAMAAIASRKTRKPVLLKFDRATDMQNVGKRHPHISDYVASYTDDGIVQGMDVNLRLDGGSTIDCSMAVAKGGVMMSDGCYRTPTFRSGATVYRTNKTSNTAMRTFGQVQPHLVLEDAIEHIAFDLSQRSGRKVRPEEIRRKNMYLSSQYETADSTHFGQPLWYCDLREQWDSFYASTEFEKRANQVDEFNKTHRWVKRGISMIPLKYGIGFKQMPALNTSTALVHINKTDGSVTVIHGGVEMGQGLHTKIAQLAAHELDVPLSSVRVARNNTDVIVNAPATAASTGFDLNGGAVAMACRTLKARLEAVCENLRERKPELGDLKLQWREKFPLIVEHAWTQSVNLTATELYKAPHYDTPVDHYDKGKFFAYFTYSFSISEVEIDVLTGAFTVLRTDLLYDAGKSLNPAIDIGQIEGGFVQGLGFVTTEDPIYDHDGRLITDNIWTYKPPCSKTIPLDLRVSLVKRDTAECFKQQSVGLLAVQASKSTSEPCLSLGNSVYFAIKHAIMDARKEQIGKEEWLELPIPLSCQRIQTACGVSTDKLRMTKV